MLRVNLINETPRHLPRQLLTKLLTGAYCARRKRLASVNLLVADDEKITALNSRFLQHRFTTDVLAFADGEHACDKIQIGDIVINAELAKRESIVRRVRFDYELALYALHGFLHLLGYADHSDVDRQKMFKAQRQEFARHGIDYQA